MVGDPVPDLRDRSIPRTVVHGPDTSVFEQTFRFAWRFPAGGAAPAGTVDARTRRPL